MDAWMLQLCWRETKHNHGVAHTHIHTHTQSKVKVALFNFCNIFCCISFRSLCATYSLSPFPSHLPSVDSRPRCRLHSPFRDSLKMHSQPAAVPKETEKFKQNFWVCAEFAIWPKSVRDFLCLPEKFLPPAARFMAQHPPPLSIFYSRSLKAVPGSTPCSVHRNYSRSYAI